MGLIAYRTTLSPRRSAHGSSRARRPTQLCPGNHDGSRQPLLIPRGRRDRWPGKASLASVVTEGRAGTARTIIVDVAENAISWAAALSPRTGRRRLSVRGIDRLVSHQPITSPDRRSGGLAEMLPTHTTVDTASARARPVQPLLIPAVEHRATPVATARARSPPPRDDVRITSAAAVSLAPQVIASDIRCRSRSSQRAAAVSGREGAYMIGYPRPCSQGHR